MATWSPLVPSTTGQLIVVAATQVTIFKEPVYLSLLQVQNFILQIIIFLESVKIHVFVFC